MKAVLLRNVKNGDYFTLTNKVKYNEDDEVLAKYVYIKREYDRSVRKYIVDKFSNINDWKLMKGDRIVYINFRF